MILKPPKGAMLNRGHPYARGLIGYWLMNEGAGNIVNDLSGNGSMGIITAGATAPTWVAGKYGSALNFDGGDNINCGNNSSLNLSQFTFVASVNINSQVSNAIVFAKHNAGTQGYFFQVGDGYVKAKFNNQDQNYAIGTTLFTPGKTYHIAATYDGVALKVYVNGVDDTASSLVTDAAPTVHTGNFYFGQLYSGGLWQINSKINYGFVYNRALSATEILNLYRSSFCMFEVDL